MIADSIKYKGHSCFKNDWAGFDTIKPINLIIGRNNTGKSHMIDFVRVLCRETIYEKGWKALCRGRLDEGTLRKSFSENSSGGDLHGDHWHQNGKLFIDKEIEWEVDENGKATRAELVDNTLHIKDEAWQRGRASRLGRAGESATSRLTGRQFRHLLADRDIRTENAGTELVLGEDGSGATNIIRRFISSATLSRDLIKHDLKDALNEIYSLDGTFTEIEIRQHDEKGGSHWEVFLAEESKGLVPLSRSGSGLKTVILVLLNLLVVPRLQVKATNRYVFAFEELENNLHPSLLRRLLQFVEKHVLKEDAIAFLTTHSSVALDYFGSAPHAQITHVRHDGNSASAQAISAHFDRCGILSELGARPSDLLQANGVLWLEGPSDRFYLNRFIELFSDGNLREGKDYQCAFYGGSLLANSQFSAPEEAAGELSNLLRLNANVALVCDGDRTSAAGEGSKLKDRVLRIASEMAKIPRSKLWITEAKEIENYIPGEVWKKVYAIDSVRDPTRFDKFPSKKLNDSTFVKNQLRKASFDKVEFAMEAVPHLTKDLLRTRFELEDAITGLVETIKLWNK